jgi:hypothetical protein
LADISSNILLTGSGAGDTSSHVMNAQAKQAEFTAEEIAAAVVNNFKVGDGATFVAYSDRRAYTVIKVTAQSVTLQRDKATLLNGHKSTEADKLTFTPGGFVGHTEGVQRYAYEADPNGEIIVARLKRKPRKASLECQYWTKFDDGSIRSHKLVPHFAAGSAMVVPGRSEHYDFNF